MAKTRGNLNLLSIYIYLKYIKHVGGFVIHQTCSSIKHQLTWKSYTLLTILKILVDQDCALVQTQSIITKLYLFHDIVLFVLS